MRHEKAKSVFTYAQFVKRMTSGHGVATPDGDWSQVSRVTHTGALLIGTYDRFTDGAPAAFLENINSHFPKTDETRLVFIEKTGHTYQQKHREVADAITRLVLDWHRKETHEESV